MLEFGVKVAVPECNEDKDKQRHVEKMPFHHEKCRKQSPHRRDKNLRTDDVFF